jgi:hypothetical protein
MVAGLRRRRPDRIPRDLRVVQRSRRRGLPAGLAVGVPARSVPLRRRLHAVRALLLPALRVALRAEWAPGDDGRRTDRGDRDMARHRHATWRRGVPAHPTTGCRDRGPDRRLHSADAAGRRADAPRSPDRPAAGCRPRGRDVDEHVGLRGRRRPGSARRGAVDDQGQRRGPGRRRSGCSGDAEPPAAVPPARLPPRRARAPRHHRSPCSVRIWARRGSGSCSSWSSQRLPRPRCE